MEKLKIGITAWIFIMVACFVYADTYKVVPQYNQWQDMTIQQKAQTIMQFKNIPADMKKIDTLIALSPPMTNDEKLQLKNYENEILNQEDKKNDLLDDNPLTIQALKQADELKTQNLITPTDKTTSGTEGYKQKNLISILKNYESEHQEKLSNSPESQKPKNVISKTIDESKSSPSDPTCYDDGNFPAGKYITLDDLKSLRDAEFKNNVYYFIGKLKIDSKFNDSYICSNNQDESFWDNLFTSSDKDTQFSIRFPYKTDYLKKGSILFFSQVYPLNIESIEKFKDSAENSVTKINCIYYGKTVHAVNPEESDNNQ